VCLGFDFEDARLNSCYRLPPDRGLSNLKYSGVKGKKVRLTYALTTNATGTETLPPLIIGHAEKPRAFHGKTGAQLGFYYRKNAKAWMTTLVYQEWLQQWDAQLRNQNRKVVLLQDNFSGHIPPDGIQNIHVINFSPNLTAHVQPMDQGIIRCFKAHYRKHYIQRAVDLYDTGTSPSSIYNIDQLEAMRLAEAAWKDVDTITIAHCWRKAAILPISNLHSTHLAPAIPVSVLLNENCSNFDVDMDMEMDGADLLADVEHSVEVAMDDLQSRGVLQNCNRMDINSLLNPEIERNSICDTTDEEICKAVMTAWNVGEDVETEELNPPPTRREVLQASLVIKKYLDGMEDQDAREIDALLHKFRSRLRLEASNALVPTRITDFFMKS
jgi:hypothetical protein